MAGHPELSDQGADVGQTLVSSEPHNAIILKLKQKLLARHHLLVIPLSIVTLRLQLSSGGEAGTAAANNDRACMRLLK